MEERDGGAPGASAALDPADLAAIAMRVTRGPGRLSLGEVARARSILGSGGLRAWGGTRG